MPNEEPRSLAILAQGAQMLAEARSLDDFKVVRDLALTAQQYARKRGLGLEAQNTAGVIAAEAAIREGEVLKRMREGGERATGGNPPAESQNGILHLGELGISAKEASESVALFEQADVVREAAAKSKAGNKPVTLGRLARIARDAKAKARAKPEISGLPATCDLRLGDFREVLADVPDGSVDVVLTDPPYPAEFLPLWGDLGVFARRVLKPNGLLVAMSGQLHMPEVIPLLGASLPYRWTIAYLMPGAAKVVHARKVNTMWKPVLVYGGNGRRLFDVARSETADKTHHGWGQSETGMAEILRLVADPGQTICDPFTGGGTTAVVALAAGCPFVGAEIDKATYEMARRRLTP